MTPPKPTSAGTLIGGRFRREVKAGVHGDGVRWSGVDVTSGDRVEILEVSPSRAGAVTDSAVRASVISDPRVPRLLDVVRPSEKDKRGYVITAAAVGRPLTELISSDPLSVPEASRIVSEVGQALSLAEAVGIHHGNLRPESVLVGDGGAVTVTGVGVEGDLVGVPEDRACDADLRSLSGLLYASLTGYWPAGDVASSSLPAAPVVNELPVPPSEIATGVPDELSALCIEGLSTHPTAATSVADLAARLRGRTATPAAVPAAEAPRWLDPEAIPSGIPPADDQLLTPDDALAPEEFEDGRFDFDELEDTDYPDDYEPEVTRRSLFSGGFLGRLFGPRGEEVDAYDEDAYEDEDEDGFAPDTDDTSVWEAEDYDAESSENEPTYDEGAAAEDPEGYGYQEEESLTVDADPARAPRKEPFVRTVEALHGFKPQKAAAAVASAASAAAASPTALRATQQVRSASQSAQRAMERMHPEIPHLTSEEKRSRTKTVVAIFSGGMALALVLALISILTLFRNTDQIAKSLEPTTAPTTAKPAAKPAAAPVTLAVSAEDPLGDKSENDDRADLVIDKKANTSWVSSTYRSESFSGLKTGVGLMFTLKAAAPVSQVTVTQAGQGGTVEVRNAPQGTYEGSSVVGKSQMQSPATTITLAKKPVTKNVLVWFTQLPKTDGRYRLQISEITLK